MDDDEFIYTVLPGNVPLETPIPSGTFLIGFYADVTVMTSIDVEEGSEREYRSDLDYTEQERFVYEKDLTISCEELLDERISRPKLSECLKEIYVTEGRRDSVIDDVLEYFKRWGESRGNVVAVNVEIVRYDLEDGMDVDEEEGMEEKEVEEMPFRPVMVDKELSLEMDCRICWSEFLEGSTANKLKCGHVFHYKCLLKWLFKSVTCPLCRQRPPGFHTAADYE